MCDNYYTQYCIDSTHITIIWQVKTIAESDWQSNITQKLNVQNISKTNLTLIEHVLAVKCTIVFTIQVQATAIAK